MEYLHPLGLTGTHGLIASAILGLAFGFILVKSQIASSKTVRDQLAMKNGRFFTTIFASLAFGIIAFHYARRLGIVNYNIKESSFWTAEIGGMLCAFGLALCGLFPSSAIASLSSGRIYSLWAISGMLASVPFVYIVKDFLVNTVYCWPSPFPYCRFLPEMFSNPSFYLWAAGFSAILSLFFELMPSSQGDGKE